MDSCNVVATEHGRYGLSCTYRSVPEIGPPFATLAFVQSKGGAYMLDATFSLVITPSLDQEMLEQFRGCWLHSCAAIPPW